MLKAYIDPSLRRTGVCIVDENSEKTKILCRSFSSLESGVKLNSYNTSFLTAETMVFQVVSFLQCFEIQEVYFEIPASRGFFVDKALFGLSFLLLHSLIEQGFSIIYKIQPTFVGNNQKKFLLEENLTNKNLSRKDLNKLARKHRVELVKSLIEKFNLNVDSRSLLDDDSATAFLFWFFSKKENISFERFLTI